MDVFDLAARISLDKSEYENGLNEAKKSSSSFISAVGNGLKTVANIGGIAITAAATGITALTKMGVEGYAQYEQLVGGVETLFKTSQATVMKYAENAYKTAGMSANQYMETVTSFSASLIQSLDGDTAKAAEVGNMAITDMSDNANKMGTSIEMIQNAYNGFAKGNFTMLDNLKLGYGGTKTEMERLLKDAQKISGIKYDISSFADVTEAIHVMQEEMGIAGTTAREAATTIEGSLAMMKGSWENLVVGLADENADMDTLIDNFVESTATAAENLIPRIEQTIAGIGELVTAMAPIIAEALPQLIEALLPALISSAAELVSALANAIITALPAIGEALLSAVQIILTDVFGVSEEKAGEFASGVNNAFNSIKDGFLALVEEAQTEGTWLNEIWTGLQETAQLFGDFLVALWDAISAAFAWCVEQINTEGTFLNEIWEGIKSSISAAVEIIQGIIQTFTALLQGDWSGAWEACKQTLDDAWEYIKGVLEGVGEFFVGLWDGVKEGASGAWEGIKSAFGSVADWFGGVFADAWQAVKDVFSTGGEVFAGITEGIVSTFKTVVNAIIDGINTVIATPLNAINDILKTIRNVEIAGMKPFSWIWTFTVPQIPKLSTGLNYVPFDEYPALLHRGEAVLTAAEARSWRRGQPTPAMAGGVTINQYIQAVPQTPVEMAEATAAYFEQARWML